MWRLYRYEIWEATKTDSLYTFVDEETIICKKKIDKIKVIWAWSSKVMK